MELGTVITRSDTRFHQPAFHEPSWTETNWFCWIVPEAKMRGHLRVLFKANLGVVASEILVYSKVCDSVLDADYYHERFHMPMPADNLHNYRTEHGVSVKMTEPLQRWLVRYDGMHDTVFDLEAEGLHPPLDTSETRVPDSRPGYTAFHRLEAGSKRVGHIDQTMHMTGTVRINGRDYDVDFPAQRDHSWSPRAEFNHRIRGNFDDGHFGRDFTFQVQTRNDSFDAGEVTNGYILDHGTVIALKAGTARYERDGLVIKRLEYDLEDVNGKSYRFTGTPETRFWNASGNAYSVIGFTRWEHEGEAGIGEYRWHWDVQLLQGLRRDGEI